MATMFAQDTRGRCRSKEGLLRQENNKKYGTHSTLEVMIKEPVSMLQNIQEHNGTNVGHQRNPLVRVKMKELPLRGSVENQHRLV